MSSAPAAPAVVPGHRGSSTWKEATMRAPPATERRTLINRHPLTSYFALTFAGNSDLCCACQAIDVDFVLDTKFTGLHACGTLDWADQGRDARAQSGGKG